MNVPIFILACLRHWREARRSRQDFLERRLRRFRRFVNFVQEHSPFYRDVIGRNRIDLSSCTPEDFPVLTKREVMQNFDEIITVPGVSKSAVAEFLSRSKDPSELFQGKYIVLHTSGSSGEIGYFVYSLKDWARGFSQMPRLHPFNPLRRNVAFFGATSGHFAGITQIDTIRRSFFKLLYDVRTFEINSPLQPVLDGLNEFQPDVLIGYPSALMILAARQNSQELRIAPSVLETSGEPMDPELRRFVETAFGRPLQNLYSSTEHMMMGVARTESDGMVLYEDDLIFELRPDHTCVTNLFNFTLPLIRYRMDDVLIARPDLDRAMPFMKVKEIVGRMEQAPVFLNRRGKEDLISPHIINEFHVLKLKRFQMQVVSSSAFIFRVCIEKGLGEAERAETLREIEARLREILLQKEMETVSFKIEEVDSLGVDPRTGKFRLILHLKHAEEP